MYTQEEVTIWRERLESGPHLRRGDRFENSFNSGEWIKAFVTEYETEKNEYVNNTPPSGAGSVDLFFKTMYTAWMYLLYKAKAHGEKVRQTILNQVKQPGTNFSLPGKSFPFYSTSNPDGIFHLANAIVRLWNSYQYTKNMFPTEEKASVEKWFIQAAYYFKANTHESLRNVFPDRLKKDYSNAKIGYADHDFAYKDKNGVKRNQIHWLHKYYNNRLMSQITIIGLVGIELGIQDLKDYAIQTCKEYLKYAVFPDGSTSEYERNYNNNYGRPNTGTLYYQYACLAPIIWIAEALRRKGDASLYDYKTSEGIYGTEGEKSLWTVIETTCKIVNNEIEWYAANPSGDKNDRIRVMASDGRYSQLDCLFSLANLHYKSDYIQKTITRAMPVSTPYPDRNFTSIGGWWYGHGGTYSPGYLMCYEGISVDDEEPIPEVPTLEDVLVSSHKELNKAIQSAINTGTGKSIIRKGNYEVRIVNGIITIFQPNIEVK